MRPYKYPPEAAFPLLSPVEISDNISTQPALDELRQELALNCCEVVLKKANGQLLSELVQQAQHLRAVWKGDSIGSLDVAMHVFIKTLERVEE